ncbi:mechanosensitive ion channel family protein [Nocardiopsis chromatogenes]|uniref:mechanosensitive ion channel family protein n=1 Tax=Nocardiopsis chromatogenes TaxID=280239 RepID=UPI00034D82B3|nr:mechanosensitive ion channel domain-containing protein [Nocardiopsis chromatogenes]
MDLMQWTGIAIAVLVATGLVAVVHWLLTHQLSKVWTLAGYLVKRCRYSAYVAAAAIGVNLSLPSVSEMEDRSLYGPINHALAIAMIIGVTWLATSAAYAVTDAVLAKLADSNGDADRRARRLRTQVRLTRRVVTGVIVVIATASVLFTFDSVRLLGAGLLTSAGVVGIVAGVAAQSTLANLFAGLQLTFGDALRINDIIVFEGEWGRVEEISLTHVTLRIWDERRLVVPVADFTSKPFENWTKHGTEITGTVVLQVDWEVPIEEIRREVGAFVTAHPLWDGRRWSVQAIDVLDGGVQLRAVVTTADSDARWDLSCDLREHLITYIAEHFPEALPRRRTEFIAGDAEAAERALRSEEGEDGRSAVLSAAIGGRGRSAQAPDGALGGGGRRSDASDDSGDDGGDGGI